MAKSKARGRGSARGPGRGSARSTEPAAGSPGRVRPGPTILACAVLAIAILAAFSPALHAGFTNYDDELYVTSNRGVNQGLSAEAVRWAFTTFHAANWHPLTWLSHQLDVTLWGLEPHGHHMVSLLLHTINAVLDFYHL